jgi:acetyl esterase/lipase
MQLHTSLRLTALALASTAFLAACGGSDDDPVVVVPEETRAQDSRTFTVADPTGTTFAAMAAAAGDVTDMSTTSRWAGVLKGSNYRVEVPANWNGKLVMYAHGYAGTGAVVGVQNPSIRRYLIQQGYAWAASSYSKNYYDVRAGVEDTNALALEFVAIATKNSRPLAAPSKIFITGHSMGGHITAAAIEDETFATAVNKVRYNGAVPMMPSCSTSSPRCRSPHRRWPGCRSTRRRTGPTSAAW